LKAANLNFRRLAGKRTAAEAVNWLVDTDVMCQPAKRRGNPRVVAWLERERDQCYTSAVVIAQLTYWVRTKTWVPPQ
jgi:hypothetical protein